MYMHAILCMTFYMCVLWASNRENVVVVLWKFCSKWVFCVCLGVCVHRFLHRSMILIWN